MIYVNDCSIRVVQYYVKKILTSFAYENYFTTKKANYSIGITAVYTTAILSLNISDIVNGSHHVTPKSTVVVDQSTKNRNKIETLQ